ncbi:hypothetical protein BU25DRAFT_490998 [Macroventuria anomochaeta]|uniref:Uncharacterized protein n=1 Tax=Macroventuria anomochaeta TaxID=301207 RepID=A0ACB6S2E6_9PLEO|nr:uncharacterized protein BU25DRAFT_490998 [Macroventuria anomochaeta]KAF2627835.1 hypothetical protein BU25DRAFT_490998 [Macroventuria anomochaeta]
MAKLSHPADSSHATPVADRTLDATTGSPPAMSSPPPRSLSLEASLQSHGNDNLPHSPPRRGSERSSFSPADCRTLKKILRDVGNNSPPPTPSPFGPIEQLFSNTDRTSSTVQGRTDENEGYRFVSDEAADTGYEDEDDSMELSEGMEGLTSRDTVSSLGDPASPSVSKSDRRLQDSISMHDEKDRLKYTGHRSSTTKHSKAKRQEQEHDDLAETTRGDTIEDVMNLPGKRAPPACPLDLGCRDLDRRPIPDDIKQLNRMRLSMEKVLEDERVEQERAEGEEPGIFIPGFSPPHDMATGVDESGLDEFDADKEDTTVHGSGAQRRKTPDRAHIQFTTNQNVPETPFTKTLSYFKQYKGTENSPSKRRRNTALPQEIADVADVAIDAEDKTAYPDQKELQSVAPDTSALPTVSALADLEGIVPPKTGKATVSTSHPVDEGDESRNVPASTNAVPEETFSKGKAVSESAPNDTQKQLILYPQHPAFINAIGMIPATMFWATAAPIVKYTNIAVDLLTDKLRDTYL